VSSAGDAERLESREPVPGPRAARAGAVERVAAVAATLAALLGTLALFAVFVFWGASNSAAALPYFAVPGALLGLSILLGYRAWLA
jgi:hypothetical protein